MWRWWPCFVGGFCGPLLARVLSAWVPLYAATAAAFFLMWVVVGLIFTVLPPGPKWSLTRWIAGGGVGALVAGALAFVVHSR